MLTQAIIGAKQLTRDDADTPSKLIDAATAADSYDGSAPLRARRCEANPTLVLRPRLSVASATCAMYVLLYHVDQDGNKTLMGLASPGVQTASADANVRDAAAGKYVAAPLYFDIGGAHEFDVRVKAPSSGNIDIYAELSGPVAKTVGST